MAISINRMGTAAVVLAAATCCGAVEASAQLFLDVGSRNGNAGITSNIGTGGPGSAAAVEGLNEPVIGSNRSSVPLFNQDAGRPLGVNGNPAGTGQGSLSSAASSSPVDSVTNTLMGPVSSAVSRSTNPPPPNPASKRKQQTKTAGAGANPPPR